MGLSSNFSHTMRGMGGGGVFSDFTLMCVFVCSLISSLKAGNSGFSRLTVVAKTELSCCQVKGVSFSKGGGSVVRSDGSIPDISLVAIYVDGFPGELQ